MYLGANTHLSSWVCIPLCILSLVLRHLLNRVDTFLRADALLDEGESVTHRFDCNTVGPVPAASGYGSRTLTHSAVHMLDSSKDHASALSSLYEKIHTQNDDNGLRELSEAEVGYFKIPSFTGSHLRLEKKERYRGETI